MVGPLGCSGTLLQGLKILPGSPLSGLILLLLLLLKLM